MFRLDLESFQQLVQIIQELLFWQNCECVSIFVGRALVWSWNEILNFELSSNSFKFVSSLSLRCHSYKSLQSRLAFFINTLRLRSLSQRAPSSQSMSYGDYSNGSRFVPWSLPNAPWPEHFFLTAASYKLIGVQSFRFEKFSERLRRLQNFVRRQKRLNG